MKTIVLTFLVVQVAFASAGSVKNVVKCEGGDRSPCDMEDSKCTTEAVQRAFKDFLNGDWPSVDPLNVDKVQAALKGISYTANDVVLTGMNSCTPELWKFNVKDTITFEYHLNCKGLKMTGNCEIKGALGPHTVDGNGAFEVNYESYTFKFTGEVDKSIECDPNSIFNIKSYDLAIEAPGAITLKFEDLYQGDAKKTTEIQNYMNENWKTVDQTLRGPIMEKLMATFMAKSATFYQRPTGCIFYQ